MKLTTPVLTWAEVEASLPVMAATMHRYLQQVSCSLRPASITATDQGLRLFATFLVRVHPSVTAVAQLQRVHLEDYKRWLTDDLDDPYAGPGRSLSATSRSLRLGSLRMFFTRLIEWDYPDAPTRPLLFLGDLPTTAPTNSRPPSTSPPSSVLDRLPSEPPPPRRSRRSAGAQRTPALTTRDPRGAPRPPGIPRGSLPWPR